MSTLTKWLDWLGLRVTEPKCTCDQSLPLPNDVIVPACRVHDGATRDASSR